VGARALEIADFLPNLFSKKRLGRNMDLFAFFLVKKAAKDKPL
jgi:hypothetical protein